MDLKAFSGDSFDAREWTNQTFKSAEAKKQNKEQYATSLVMKLQLLIAKLNSSVEEQSEQVCHGVPRMLREAESLQQEAQLLQAKMSAVQEEIDKVNRETGTSMENIVNMDLFKERIQAVRKALKEADNWTTLTGEIEDALDSGELAPVSEKLTGLQASLKILHHVPDYDDRVVHLEGLKNRLEALASPQLVAAFNADDAEKAKFFVKIFDSMERGPQLLKYYRKCLKARAVKMWERTVGEHQHQTVLEWSSSYFAAMEALIKEQMSWFRSVFPTASSPAENLVQVLLEAHSSLEPKFDFCLDASLKQQQQQQADQQQQPPLTYLAEVKRSVNGYAEALEAMLCDESNQNDATVRELARTIYSAFKPHTARYGQYENALLRQDLAPLSSPAASKDIIDELRSVATSVPKLASAVEAASSRCCQVTEACAYPLLKLALEDCLGSYLERYTNLMRRLDKRKAAANSWNILQQSLTLNQTSGDLLLQLEQLDITLSIAFLERTKHFLGAETNGDDRVFQQHHVFLLHPQGMDRLDKFYESVRQGTNYPVLEGCLKLTSKMCSELQASAFSIIFHPIQEELDSVTKLGVWDSSSAGSTSTQQEMPDFSFSPQEYITQIGQYLMTLPQHLEPYMTNDNPALSRAFQERVFPYCSGLLETEGQNPADFVLSCVARATCDTYQAAVVKIPTLTANSTKQLAVDIGYLGDILEDLGHPLSDGLHSVLTLLKLPAKDFWVGSTGCPQKLVSTVRNMRSLAMNTSSS